MFEVEKNFDLKPGDKERLIQGAQLIKEISLIDTYYDSEDFGLTGKDYWLRMRNGEFELKVPFNEKSIHERATDQYQELETDEEIAKALDITINSSLSESLEQAGYKPFVTIKTDRVSYSKEGFRLDFDEMDFGFITFEVELLVENSEDIPEAELKIVEFAKKHGIMSTIAHGKLIEYIFRNRPEHYLVLVNNGVVKVVS